MRATFTALALCLIFLRSPTAQGSSAGFLDPAPANDPAYVRGGAHRGFYCLRSDSPRWWNWGLRSAPVVEPSRMNNGQGRDVVAIAFDGRGQVSAAPVYITWFGSADGLVARRLLALEHGRSTLAEVRAQFGRPDLVSAVRGHLVWYYDVRIFDPFQDRTSDGGN